MCFYFDRKSTYRVVLKEERNVPIKQNKMALIRRYKRLFTRDISLDISFNFDKDYYTLQHTEIPWTFRILETYLLGGTVILTKYIAIKSVFTFQIVW